MATKQRDNTKRTHRRVPMFQKGRAVVYAATRVRITFVCTHFVEMGGTVKLWRDRIAEREGVGFCEWCWHWRKVTEIRGIEFRAVG